MRILLLYKGGGAGGDATVAFSLWDEWEAQGHEVKSFATADTYFWRAGQRNKPAVRVDSWPEIPNEDVRWADAVNLHLSNEYVTWARDGRVLARMVSKRRLFCTVHGPRPLVDVTRTLRARFAAVQGARSVNRIILPSKHKVRDWARVLPLVRNVTRIANPIYEPAAMNKAEALAALGLTGEPRKILGFVGLLRTEKGLQTALEAMKQLGRSDLLLVVAGAGPEEERLRAFAADHGVAAHFMGYMFDPSAVYRASDVFLFPSAFDNFPVALMQAGLCDVPIIASDIPVVVDEFGACNYVRRVPSGDVCALGQAIRRLVDELPIRDAGLSAHVRSTCDPRAVASRYIELFGDGK